MKPRLSLLATLGALLGVQVLAAPPPPAASPAPLKSPLAEVPASDSTLSLFEVREGRCEWLRMDPSAQKTAVVASFEGECKGARLSWHKDLGRALVWFDPTWVRPYRGALLEELPVGHPWEESTRGATPRLYEITVASGQVRPLPFPTVQGQVEKIGYNGERITALSKRILTDEEKEKDSLTAEGKRIKLEKGRSRGTPALLFAYQLAGSGRWENVAVQAAPIVYDRDISASDLGDVASLGTSAEDLLSPRLGNTASLTEEQDKQLEPLLPAPMAEKARKGESVRGQWFRGTTPAGPFYVRAISAHGLYTTGHLVLEVKGQPRVAKDLGFTASDMVALSTRGPFILVASVRVGDTPRFYDARTGQLVFHSDTARSTTFWPVAGARE